MTDLGFLWFSGGMLAIGFAALATAIVMFLQRRRSEALAPLEIIPPCAGPIARLSFAESLHPLRFAEAAEAETVAYIKLHFRDRIADGTAITLQMLRGWLAGSEMVVAPSKAMQTGAAVLGRKGFPLVADRKTGKILEIMKEVGRGRKVVAGTAAASAVIVSAAHMISAADLARTLKQVDQKLDLLLAYRRIDQAASLERIYTSGRELLASPLNEARQIEVWRLRGEMRQLRATWRGELEHHLIEIKDPFQDGWFDWLVPRRESYDHQITEKISGGQLRLMLIEYSLRLDRVLAGASGTWDVSGATLADELDAIDRMGELLKKKAELISEPRREAVQPMIEGIKTIVHNYQNLLQQHHGLPALLERRAADSA